MQPPFVSDYPPTWPNISPPLTVGTDMTKWESAKHFASWLGLSPNNHITGGKVMSSRAKPSANRAAAALRLAAHGCNAPTAPWGPSCAGRKRTWGRRPRPSPPRRTSWRGSSTPCCATAKTTWMPAPNTTRVNINNERCALQNNEHPNWATNWCLCQMLRARPQHGDRPLKNLVSRESSLGGTRLEFAVLFGKPAEIVREACVRARRTSPCLPSGRAGRLSGLRERCCQRPGHP